MPKILDFAKKPEQRLRIHNKSATEAEIIMYAGIGQASWFEDPESFISAKQFSDELKKIDASVNNISVRINSPGGDVFDGIAIYNRLIQHPAKITTYIDGLAASISSIIALAGDEVIMGDGALYMVHLPWTFAYGNRMELDNTVNRLMDVEEQMIGIYARKTGMDRNEIKALLEAETWMGAEEALTKGFVDTKVVNSTPIAASAIEKSPWIVRKPKTYNSETSAISAAKSNLSEKIRSRIARK